MQGSYNFDQNKIIILNIAANIYFPCKNGNTSCFSSAIICVFSNFIYFCLEKKKFKYLSIYFYNRNVTAFNN